MSQVLKSRDVDQMQFEATMKVLPRLVARSDHAVEELALELVQILLHLKCKYFNVMPHLKYVF